MTVLLIDNHGLSHYTSYLAYGLSNRMGIDVILYGFSTESYVVTGAARDGKIIFNDVERKLPIGESFLKTVFRPLFFFRILLEAVTKNRYDIVTYSRSSSFVFLVYSFPKTTW